MVDEDGSGAAALLVETATEVVSASIVYVEARSALGRATHDGRLPGTRASEARMELDRVWREMSVVELDLDLVARSGDVAEAARLRAGDAVHLASALTIDEPELLFVTWDHELHRAARAAGLAVAP